MAVDCYTVAHDVVSFAMNGVLLRRHRDQMHLLPAIALLYFGAIDILGEPIKTACGNRFLFMVRVLFSKLERTISVDTITAQAVAQAFATQWLWTFGPPVCLLSDIVTQVTSRLFQDT